MSLTAEEITACVPQTLHSLVWQGLDSSAASTALPFTFGWLGMERGRSAEFLGEELPVPFSPFLGNSTEQRVSASCAVHLMLQGCSGSLLTLPHSPLYLVISWCCLWQGLHQPLENLKDKKKSFWTEKYLGHRQRCVSSLYPGLLNGGKGPGD